MSSTSAKPNPDTKEPSAQPGKGKPVGDAPKPGRTAQDGLPPDPHKTEGDPGEGAD